MNNTRKRVLIWPSTTELANELVESLFPMRFYTLIGAASDADLISRKEFESQYYIPNLGEPNVLETLAEVVDRAAIDVIYPTHDDAIVFVAANAGRFKNQIVVAPAEELAHTLRSKHQTYDRVADIIDLPKRFYDVDSIEEYPVFVKPDRGSGSAGAKVVSSRLELLADAGASASYFEDNVVAEYLPGEEFTVDCLSGAAGDLIFAGPRARGRVRNGISTDTWTCDGDEFDSMARLLASRLRLQGAWFFQVRRDSTGLLRLLEVAVRFGGSSKLNRLRGINFGHLSILARSGEAFSVLINPTPSRLLRRLGGFEVATRPSAEVVFVDLDDCVLRYPGPTVYGPLIGKIIEWRNDRARVVLVTRHEGDVQATLRSNHLEGFFDDVLHAQSRSEKKSEMIRAWLSSYNEPVNSDSILFIDDSFGERLDVGQSLDIRTFDLTMLGAI